MNADEKGMAALVVAVCAGFLLATGLWALSQRCPWFRAADSQEIRK